MRVLWNVVFVRGAAAGVTETVASSAVLLAPYCVATGYLLTLACLLAGELRGAESVAAVYYCDSVGGVAAGVATSFALACWFDHFTHPLSRGGLELAAAACVAGHCGRRRWLIAAVAAAAVLACLIAPANLDRLSTHWQYPGQELLYHGNSPYGRLVVTRSAGQYNFIENGLMLFSTANVAAVEETVPLRHGPASRCAAGAVDRRWSLGHRAGDPQVRRRAAWITWNSTR